MELEINGHKVEMNLSDDETLRLISTLAFNLAQKQLHRLGAITAFSSATGLIINGKAYPGVLNINVEKSGK